MTLFDQFTVVVLPITAKVSNKFHSNEHYKCKRFKRNRQSDMVTVNKFVYPRYRRPGARHRRQRHLLAAPITVFNIFTIDYRIDRGTQIHVFLIHFRCIASFHQLIISLYRAMVNIFTYIVAMHISCASDTCKLTVIIRSNCK